MMRDILLAVAFVLAGSVEGLAVAPEPRHAILTWEDGVVTDACVKTEELCDEIPGFIALHHWPDKSHGRLIGLQCNKDATCFPAETNCIKGYHGPRPEGYCK